MLVELLVLGGSLLDLLGLFGLLGRVLVLNLLNLGIAFLSSLLILDFFLSLFSNDELDGV